MLGELLPLGLGALPQLVAALAEHMVPIAAPNCVPCKEFPGSSPDQCLVSLLIILVRALMYHPC